MINNLEKSYKITKSKRSVEIELLGPWESQRLFNKNKIKATLVVDEADCEYHGIEGILYIQPTYLCDNKLRKFILKDGVIEGLG